MATLFDPLRKIEVPRTPEEEVRQWFIKLLAESAKVPPRLMRSEVSFNLGDKKYRADILIWDRNARPLAVVECKKPSVPLSKEVLDQAIRYNMALDLGWLMLTNGNSTVVLRKKGNIFETVNQFPTYAQLLEQ